MGGNALSTKSVRLQAKEYYDTSKEVLGVLVRNFPNCEFNIPPSYKDKPSFGDLDIIFCRKDCCATSSGILVQEFAQALNAVEVVRNYTVTSIGIKDILGVFQLDLIEVPEDRFDFAWKYFSYNDLGNLIGRVSKRFGVKFGHLGLQKEYTSDYLQGKRSILLTKDFEKALKFLGYSAEEYEKGFNTKQDIFKYVASSKLFSQSAFDFANRTGKDRRRDSKRIIYKEFLSWCSKQKNLQENTEIEVVDLEIKLREEFPGYEREFDNLVQLSLYNEKALKILNFQVVKSLIEDPSIKDEDIGNALRYVRGSLGHSKEIFEKYQILGEECFRKEVKQILTTVKVESEKSNY